MCFFGFFTVYNIIIWEIDGETVETVSDFIFWEFKVTADGDRSHEIKRCLLLGRKAMIKLDSILKSKDIRTYLLHAEAPERKAVKEPNYWEQSAFKIDLLGWTVKMRHL